MLYSFRILQYNVNKSKNKVMASLLRDPNLAHYDVIAIQEPWRNTHNWATYNPRDSGFHSIDLRKQKSRVCCYINKKISTDSWSETFHSDDLITITLRLAGGTRVINIHNCYNPPPRSHSEATDLGTLNSLPHALRMPGEHILLGDFNLHHPFWCGPSYPHQHLLSETLFTLVRNADASLALPRGTITRRIQSGRRTQETTIDLVFMTQALISQVHKCRIASELEHGSDHLPVSTELEWQTAPDARPIRKRRAWKKLDQSKFFREFDDFADTFASLSLSDREEIDGYVARLSQAISNSIEASTPWLSPSEFSKAYWTPECAKAIKTSRRLRRAYNESRTTNAWKAFTKARNKKGNVIAKAKRAEFREHMRIAGESKDGIWRIARWARQRAQGIHPQVSFPPLTKDGNLVHSPKEKAELLRDHHHPPPPQADLSDIDAFEYPEPIFVPAGLEQTEVIRAIQKSKKDSAPGPDEIPNRILQLLASNRPAPLIRLFDACYRLGIHPTAFKRATTVMIRKHRRADYSDPTAYRPIALLNTLGKALEAVIAERIRFAAETYKLLPNTQMGARRMRSTETALQLITNKIHTIWGANRARVASLLSLDISGAFPNVSHARLIHNLRKRRIPREITNWVSDFLQNRETEIRLGDFTLESSRVFTGIPQGSRISPILYLFYNADLLEICENITLRTSATGFVDDINILTFSTSTEQNCRNLERIHLACEEWATRHGSAFNSSKYDLIHFSRSPKRFNMLAEINISSSGHRVKPKTDVRVLGVQLDPALRWKPHLRAVEARAVHHLNALKTLTGSTWGASLETGLRVYSAAIRPALLYGCSTWYSPENTPGYRKGVARELQAIQGRCLRAITGAYKATSTESLEIETFTPPIHLYAEMVVANSICRTLATDLRGVIDKATDRIRRQLRGKRGRAAKFPPTPLSTLKAWIEKTVGGLRRLEIRKPGLDPPWRIPLNIEIAPSKGKAIMLHASDTHSPYLRLYTDGSGQNDRISTAAVGNSYHHAYLLGTSGDAQVFHGELAGVDLALHLLLNRTPESINPSSSVIYSDSQAALQFLQKGNPSHSQSLFEGIIAAVESLAQRGIQVILRWIPGHMDIPGNEIADRHAVNAARFIGPYKEPATRFLSAIKRQIKDSLLIRWKKRWKQSWESRDRVSGTARLTPEVTRSTRALHSGLRKEYSALLIQLRTGIIGFNEFLFRRRVPSVLSPRCPCDTGTMTVHHVLLSCPTWSALRMGILGDFRTTDLRKLLNSYKGAIAAVRFILQTDLLAQFSLVAKVEQAKRLRNADPEESNRHRFSPPPPGNRPPIDASNLENTDEEENREESEPDISQSDSENGDISDRNRTPLTDNESS